MMNTNFGFPQIQQMGYGMPGQQMGFIMPQYPMGMPMMLSPIQQEEEYDDY